jgi:RIO-like serine/threonine protein kinase
MDLIKETTSKFREVWHDGEYYYKTWNFVDRAWLEAHVKLLDIYAEGLVVDYLFKENSMTIKMNTIEGTLASTFEHTQEFFDMIYSACIKDLDRTAPYAHGDWVLSNMIITPKENVVFIDWDNINLFPKKGAIMKMHLDLKSAFGDKFERFLNDPASV